MQTSSLNAPLALALLLALAGCNIGGPDNEAIVDEDVLNSTLLPELPRDMAPLDRHGLMEAVDDAAGAFELNADDREAQAQLVNRQFVLRIPFACGGISVPSGALTATLRPDGKAMTITATPDISATTLGTGSKIDKAEGFWVPRPWISGETCPAAPAAPDVDPGQSASDNTVATPPPPKVAPMSALSEKTAGLVQFVGEQDTRQIKRAGKAYTVDAPVEGGKLPVGGLALRIEGRLRPFPTGQVIRCRVAAAGLRPICFASIQADRIAFERIEDKTILGEWKN